MLKTLFCLKIAASDWSVVIISNLPFSLTRGEYLGVVGILEMVEQIGISTCFKMLLLTTN